MQGCSGGWEEAPAPATGRQGKRGHRKVGGEEVTPMAELCFASDFRGHLKKCSVWGWRVQPPALLLWVDAQSSTGAEGEKAAGKGP